MFCANFEECVEKIKEKEHKNLRKFLLMLLDIAKKLNINVDFHKNKVDSITGKIN